MTTTTTPTPTKKSPRRWPWGILWMLVWLVLLEVGVRRSWNPVVVGEERYKDYYPAYDYGFTDLPLCWRGETERVCQPTPYYDIHRQTLPLRKKAKDRLVVTIGASVARGKRGSFSTELEKRLGKAHPKVDLQVLNLAASSIGSTRMLLRVREALRYKPDLLIVQLHGENESKDARDLAYSQELHGGLAGSALRSRAVVVLKKYFASELEVEIPTYGARDATTERERTPEAWARDMEVMEQNLTEMLALARAARVPVVLMSASSRTRGFVGDHDREINAMLLRHAGKGVQYFDTGAALDKGGKPKELFRDGHHFTSRGHRYVAAGLLLVVRKTLKLGEGPRGKRR